MPMSVGAVFAGYTIVGLLTSGAVGEVYLAQHPRLPRQEELTILSAAASADPDVRRRFEHEAGIAAGLSHPHISAVRDRGEHDGRLWFTTDHLNGTTAATLLHTDSPAGMPTKQVCDIVDAIADALDYAHTEDLLHREVSPSHILLTEAGNSRRGRILLTDFGIARDTGETTLNTSTAALAYSSPEQLMGQPLDGRTDQYSLAATAYHLLTGRPPFAHTNTAVLISNHLTSPPPRLADTHPNLAALDPVVARALSKDPTNRYNTCTEFAQALTTSCSGHTGAAPSLAPPTTATTTETHDLPQPPTTLSDWGTPQPPPTKESPSAALLEWRAGDTPAATPPPAPPPTPPPVQANPSVFDSMNVRAAGAGVGIMVVIVIVGIVVAAVSSDRDPPKTATTTAPPVTGNTTTSVSAGPATSPPSESASHPGVAGPARTIVDYIIENHITEVGVKRGDPGAPYLSMPIPYGWEDAGNLTPDWAYGAIVYTGDPRMAQDPPSIIAILSKLIGDVDPAEILQLAAGEIHNLPDFDGPLRGKPSSLGGFDATQIGGTYVRDGERRVIAQKTVVIPGEGGVYILQLNADGLENQAVPLMEATKVIDDETTIRPWSE